MSQPCRKDTLTRVSASRSRRPAKGTVARSDDLTNLRAAPGPPPRINLPEADARRDSLTGRDDDRDLSVK